MKKLIAFNAGGVDPTLLLRPGYLSVWEDLPYFDGAVFHLLLPEGRFLSQDCHFHAFAWGKQWVALPSAASAADLVTLLRASTKLKTNFLRVNACPRSYQGWEPEGDQTIHWFSPEEEILRGVFANLDFAARVAQAAGCHILLDTEDYQYSYKGDLVRWFTYEDQTRIPQNHGRGWSDYVKAPTAASQDRGVVFWWGYNVLDTIQRAYPNVTVVFTAGHLDAWYRFTHPPEQPADTQQTVPAYDSAVWSSLEYGLIPQFINGMLSARLPGTRLVNFSEFTYDFKTHDEYELLTGWQTTGISPLLANQAELQNLGFAAGSMFDHFKPDADPGEMSPDEYEISVRLAKQYTDEFVILYNEHSWGPWQCNPNPPNELQYVVCPDNVLCPPPYNTQRAYVPAAYRQSAAKGWNT